MTVSPSEAAQAALDSEPDSEDVADELEEMNETLQRMVEEMEDGQ